MMSDTPQRQAIGNIITFSKSLKEIQDNPYHSFLFVCVLGGFFYQYSMNWEKVNWTHFGTVLPV